MWYAMAPAVSFGIFGAGAIWWLVRFQLLPKVGKYELIPRRAQLSDDTHVTVFDQVPIQSIS